jgi:7-carboxy-7-deazaguanine synthase
LYFIGRIPSYLFSQRGTLVRRNLQVVEKKVEREDGSIEIVGAPFLTIQGEGPFVGEPAIFVRLAGCDLQCPECDTNYTSDRRLLSALELVSAIETEAAPLIKKVKVYRNVDTKLAWQGGSWKYPLVVITGGEPFRQTCGPLVKALLGASYRVQFETNGTLFDSSLIGWYKHCTVVCSPKAGKIDDYLSRVITHYKYVVQHGRVDPDDGLPTDVLGSGVKPARPWKYSTCPIYVQPADEQDALLNEANLQTALQSCMKFGYTLSVQVHKIIGLP